MIYAYQNELGAIVAGDTLFVCPDAPISAVQVLTKKHATKKAVIGTIVSEQGCIHVDGQDGNIYPIQLGYMSQGTLAIYTRFALDLVKP